METADTQAPSSQKQRSAWALLIVTIAAILCGLFFVLQSRDISQQAPVVPQKTQGVIAPERLEAAAANITIPDYSDTL